MFLKRGFKIDEEIPFGDILLMNIIQYKYDNHSKVSSTLIKVLIHLVFR